MRADLLKVLLEVCDRNILASLPEFEFCSSQQFLAPGRLYIDSSFKPTFFIFFHIHDERDRFTVELAWSQSENFPSYADYPLPRDWPEIGAKRGDRGVDEFRFRLTKLWVKPKYDPWWEFEPPPIQSKSAAMSVVADEWLDDTAKCEQLVADAVQKILDFGLPYISEIRNRKGEIKGI